MLVLISNVLHFVLLFIPSVIYIIPNIISKKILKFIFLGFMLTPIHWVLLDNKCILTLYTKNKGGLQDTETDSEFSEVYMKWLYKPIMDIIGWRWNTGGLNKMVNLHMGINLVLLWYYLF